MCCCALHWNWLCSPGWPWTQPSFHALGLLPCTSRNHHKLPRTATHRHTPPCLWRVLFEETSLFWLSGIADCFRGVRLHLIKDLHSPLAQCTLGSTENLALSSAEEQWRLSLSYQCSYFVFVKIYFIPWVRVFCVPYVCTVCMHGVWRGERAWWTVWASLWTLKTPPGPLRERPELRAAEHLPAPATSFNEWSTRLWLFHSCFAFGDQ